jgi:hypothetical protein
LTEKQNNENKRNNMNVIELNKKELCFVSGGGNEFQALTMGAAILAPIAYAFAMPNLPHSYQISAYEVGKIMPADPMSAMVMSIAAVAITETGLAMIGYGVGSMLDKATSAICGAVGNVCSKTYDKVLNKVMS